MELILFYFFGAIAVSFLCSVLEAVLLSVTPSFVELTVSQNGKNGEVLKKVKEEIDSSISGILTLNTIAHTVGAAGVGAETMRLFGEEYMFIASVILTLGVLYLSEIVPKTIGAVYWQKLAIPSAYTIMWLTKFAYPFIIIGQSITKAIKKGDDSKVSREEILAFAEMGEKDGVVTEKEGDLLEKLFEFKDTKVKEVMTPSTVMFAVEKGTTASDFLKLEDYNTHSRVPVYDGTIDDIIGLVFKNKILVNKIEGKDSVKVEELMKPVFHISENVPLTKAMDLFIKKKEHLFIVHDSYGQTMGIVTLEDAIETLLGVEIMDELDKVEDLQELAKKKMKEKHNGQ
ncbi:MAG: hemolysin family protein [Campylobacterales bacterium]|nr:hemolysin family protein [Campylobacterales bacterium]